MKNKAEFIEPTAAYNFNEYTKFNETLHIWDLGSSDTMHELWPSFYSTIFIQTLIYVLNPESEESVAQARSDLLFL